MIEKFVELLYRAHHNASAVIAGGNGSEDDALEEEARYLLASGQVIVLPCKVGTRIYIVHNNTDACNTCDYYEPCDSYCMNKEVDDIDLKCYPEIAERPVCPLQFMEVISFIPTIDYIFRNRDEFGKSVFLTQEEAEIALKEIENK